MSDTWKASLIVILSQLPLIGGSWLWWTEKIQARPFYAALAGAGYEAILFSAAFARKVWKDELEKDAVKVTADWVRGVVGGFAPGFNRRYKRQVVREHGIFNVRGLGLVNTYTLRLDQVFVDLRIDPSNPQRFNIDPIARKELTGNRPIWDFLRDGAGIGEATALAIIGPPGSGKTTLLQHVAVTLASDRQRRHGVRAYTPVMLFLRDHVNEITRGQAPTLGRLVESHFGKTFKTLRIRPGWFERRLEGGRCMVLLDGLDEVADAEERRAVSAWVDMQLKNYPRCPFVLTARPQGYAAAPLQGAHVLEVQPFSGGQVRSFVENWYLANEIIASGGHEDEGVRQRASRDAEDLLRRLRATPPLAALTVNPLLLTMIAMVHRYRGALPGSRAELYAEICEVLLGRWRQARGVHDPLKSSQKLVILRPLAAHMMEHEVRDIKTSEAASVIALPLARVGITGEAAAKFLAGLESDSGLLLEREAGQWSFAHLTFQEYLAAAHWLEQKRTDQKWSDLVGDSWWHETLRLYAAQGDATPLVRACLEVDNLTTLTLAADFLEEASQLLPETRDAAERRLIADLESDARARRRLAAEVLLSRSLKRFEQVDEQSAVNADYVTCAEYQLFLDDMRVQGKYYQPDHWPDVEFRSGEAQQPVVGVRPQDAQAFTGWLTQRQGGNVRYRPPRPAEANGLAPHTPGLAAWCSDGGAFVLSELAADKEEEVRGQLALLSDLPVSWTLAPDLAVSANLGRALDFALTRARALALALAYGLDVALGRDPGRNRVREIEQSREDAEGLGRAVVSDLDSALEADLVGDLSATLKLVLHRARARARNPDVAYLLERAGEHVSTLAGDRNLILTRGRNLVRGYDRDHARARVRTLELNLTEALDLALDWDRDRGLALDIARARALVRAVTRDLTFDKAIDLATSLNLAHEKDRGHDRDFTAVLTRHLARDLARALAAALDNPLIVAAIDRNDLAESRRSVAEILGIANVLKNRWAKGAGGELIAGERESFLMARQAQRKYLLQVLAATYEHNKKNILYRRLYRWQRWLSLNRASRDSVIPPQEILRLYWSLQVVIAREEGKLLAWEGIRVAREQVSERRSDQE